MIALTASANDSDGTVVKVEFFRGNTKIGEATSSPYTVNWLGASAGSYAITAKATDNDGSSASSAGISITVNAVGGGGCDGLAVWSASAVYHSGDEVQFNGNRYVANYWTQNNNPEEYSDPYEQWTNKGACGSTAARTGSTEGESLNKGASVPSQLHLGQNYPNPFSQFTAIDFAIPENSDVSLVIYNSLGVEVVRVIDQKLTKGKYHYELNTSTLPHGLYHCKLRVGMHERTLKMFKK